MGTRSLTIVRDGMDEKSPRVMTMYRQCDGHPKSHGKELSEFLNSIQIVNGFGDIKQKNVANGAGCLAAQLVCHFKKGVGGIYLVSGNDNGTPGDMDEEYIYEVFIESYNEPYRIKMSCYDVVKKTSLFNQYQPIIFHLIS